MRQAAPVDQSDGIVRVLGEISEYLKRNSVYLDAATAIPTYNEESVYDTSGAATSITVPPKTSNFFEVLQVVCFIPAGASGLLQIGGIKMPVPAGVTSLQWCQLLSPSGSRNLTSTVAGTMSLALMGRILSRRMVYR
jgi:hypothetical protein